MSRGQRLEICSPDFWIDEAGNHPDQFQILTVEDIQRGLWKPADPKLEKNTANYIERLKKIYGV